MYILGVARQDVIKKCVRMPNLFPPWVAYSQVVLASKFDRLMCL